MNNYTILYYTILYYTIHTVYKEWLLSGFLLVWGDRSFHEVS